MRSAENIYTAISFVVSLRHDHVTQGHICLWLCGGEKERLYQLYCLATHTTALAGRPGFTQQSNSVKITVIYYYYVAAVNLRHGEGSQVSVFNEPSTALWSLESRHQNLTLSQN